MLLLVGLVVTACHRFLQCERSGLRSDVLRLVVSS